MCAEFSGKRGLCSCNRRELAHFAARSLQQKIPFLTPLPRPVVQSLIETLTMRVTNGPILFTSRVWWIVSDGEWDADKWLPKIISTQKLSR
jgi:hypothetical protein